LQVDDTFGQPRVCQIVQPVPKEKQKASYTFIEGNTFSAHCSPLY
jgi:hypothetical protein